jgi:DNA-directed RNA polymerase specialized sigma24 family protein
MKTGPTEVAFARLLDRLDADRAQAGERYETLRHTLVRFFSWRGAPFPDELADETLDRVARRLAEGVSVKNINGYCYEVARLVFLETRKGPQTRRASFDDHVDAVAAADPEPMHDEIRMTCLDDCLDGLPAESRDLIVGYYRDDKRARIVARKEMAERLGVRVDALANRAQRLRDRLQRCVKACVMTKSRI